MDNFTLGKLPSRTFVERMDMETAKTRLGELALTNQYLVSFSSLTDGLKKQMKRANVSVNFSTRRLGLLCSDVSLPTSTYATAEVKDNYLGVTQEFAHTRMYADMDLTFYVDNNYNTLRFFESWMDYVSGSGDAQTKDKNYHRRFAYPDQYKVDTMSIIKFERDKRSALIQYDFVNAFPKGMTSIPLSYGPAEILKVTVTFNYDRYIVNRKMGLKDYYKDIDINDLTAYPQFKLPSVDWSKIKTPFKEGVKNNQFVVDKGQVQFDTSKYQLNNQN